MQIIKYTHACVRLEQDGRVLVVDPGIWSEPGALIGADAVLVTHEHRDHVEVARLQGLGVPVFVPAGADLTGPETDDPAVLGFEVVEVVAGQTFEAAGFSVTATGGRHALIYDALPQCPNLGYLVDDALYHPGDSLHVPDRPVQALLVPAQGSWLKLEEAIGFARAIGAPRTVPIHDAQLNERGLEGVNGWFSEYVEGYQYLAPTDRITLP